MSDVVSPFRIANIQLFILFRVLFNARFYYPVFTVLFLDFGLTLSQFALLNVVWAATIVVCEVPSGAVADVIGRRNLLVFAASLMVIEVSLWAFVPRDNLTLLFWVLVVNRVLSGMAEAAASGADEALAYDSLKQQGDASRWGQVLERQMQVQAAGFVIAMTLGGVVYDPKLMQTLGDFFGLGLEFNRDSTLRLPIYLTLMTALLTLLTTLKMRESPGSGHSRVVADEKLSAAFKLVWQTGRWVFRTPFVLGLILFGLLYDSVIRMVLTMGSQYYRAIEIPEALFGVLGSMLALFGFVMPVIARRMCERRSPLVNLALTGGLILAGLAGMSFAWKWAGIIPAMLLFSNMFLIGFFLSHYLNQVASSEQRATVLSFKGLFLNLGYGIIGILYALLLTMLRDRATSDGLVLAEESLKNMIFVDSLLWFCGYFAVLLLLLVLFFSGTLRRQPAWKAL